MKTTAILALTAAAVFLGSCTTMGADTQKPHCYRTIQKLPYQVPVPCKSTDTKSGSESMQQPLATGQKS